MDTPEGTAAERAQQFIGARIKQARNERGVTQDYVTERVGRMLGKSRSRDWLSEIENGHNRIDPFSLLCIARILGYPLAYFVDPDFKGLDIERPTTTWEWERLYADDPARAKAHACIDEAMRMKEAWGRR